MYSSFFKFFSISLLILVIYSCFVSQLPLSSSSKIIDSNKFNWPLPNNYNITCYFGPRQAPTSGASSFHYGIDIAATEGSTIYSCFSGTVTSIGFKRSKWLLYNNWKSKHLCNIFSHFPKFSSSSWWIYINKYPSCKCWT